MKKEKNNMITKFEKLFEYYGGFQDDSFFGKGSIKINNGHIEMNGVFKKDIVEI